MNPAEMYDQEAEAAVIAGLVLNPSSYVRAADLGLKSGDFYVRAYGIAYEVFVTLTERGGGKTPDFLAWDRELQGINPEPVLMPCVNLFPAQAPDVAANAATVLDKSLRRRMGAVTQAALPRLNGIESATKILSDVSEQLSALSPAAAAEIYTGKDLARLAQVGGGVRLPTGFTDLDTLWGGGLGPAWFVVVAARPGMGKTGLLLDMGINMARAGKLVLFFSLEQSAEQLAARIFSNMSGISSRTLEKGGGADTDEFVRTVRELEGLPFIVDSHSWMGSGLEARLQYVTATHGKPDVILLDYLQLIQETGGTRTDEIENASQRLKRLAKAANIPVVAASQLSRQVDTRQVKRPQLSDLRGSGAIEQDADIVAFIYRDDYYNPDTTERPNVAEIITAKNRFGPLGDVDLYWQGSLARFRNLQRMAINL